jgi:hypothetical protein
MDILVILSLFFNVGALILTNAMAVKAKPTIQILEANPVSAQTLGYKQAPQAIQISFGFVLHCLALAFFIGNYFYIRATESDKRLKTLLITASFIFLICCLDFSNDLGYWLGKLIFSNM